MIYIHDSKAPYVDKYKVILDANQIAYETINCQDNDFWKKVQKASLYIYYPGMGIGTLLQQRNLISVIDLELNIPCFPNWRTSWHYDDKIAEAFLLSSRGYPLAASWVFWDKDKAIDWARHAHYPLVFKLKNGASSINVVKVNSVKQAEKLINLMFGRGIINNRVPGTNLFGVYQNSVKTFLRSNLVYAMNRIGLKYSTHSNYNRESGYAFFQKFITNNNFETRITIIGKSAFALRRLNRPNDFRASGAGKIDLSPEKIQLRMVELAFKISDEMGFQAMTYDFLIDENDTPVMNEIGCQCADWVIQMFPGYWDRDLIWHSGHFWPQFVQLQYLLRRDDLIQPDFPEEIKGAYSIESF